MFEIDQIIAYFLGLLTNYLLDVLKILLPIPDDLRYRISFWRKQLLKTIINPSTTFTYTLKSHNLEFKENEWETIFLDIKESLQKEGFKLKGGRAKTVSFQYETGITKIEIEMNVGIEEKEDELIVTSVQTDFVLSNGKYRSYDKNIIDIIQTVRRFDRNVRKLIGDLIADSITVKLKQFYQYSGILKEFNISTLSGKIKRKYRIDFSKNSFIIYGNLETESELLSELKKIITYYY